jgi:hypothetical protein
MSNFQTGFEDSQSAQPSRLSTGQNNSVSDELISDARENLDAEPQSAGLGQQTNGAEFLTTQNNSQPRHSSGAVAEEGGGFIPLNSGTGSGHGSATGSDSRSRSGSVSKLRSGSVSKSKPKSTSKSKPGSVSL